MLPSMPVIDHVQFAVAIDIADAHAVGESVYKD